MENAEQTNQPEKICDLTYLSEMMGGKRNMIAELMNDFVEELPGELAILNDAVKNNAFTEIKQAAHKMKSTISIMGVACLQPLLNEMEQLAIEAKNDNMERINILSEEVTGLCEQALAETVVLKEQYTDMY